MKIFLEKISFKETGGTVYEDHLLCNELKPDRN